MSGGICAMPGCNNYFVQKNYTRPFFRFPQDKELCAKWVLLCGRSDLEVALKQLGPDYMYKRFRLCSDHFVQADYNSPHFKSQRLKRFTLPTVLVKGGQQDRPMTGLSSDQLMESSYSVAINPTRPVKREQRADETSAQPEVGFVDVNSVRLRPSDLPQVSGQDVDPLMLPGTPQAGNTASQDHREPGHFKREVVDIVKREPPEPISQETPDVDRDVDPLKLSSPLEPRLSIKREVELHIKQETPTLQSDPTDPVCSAELQDEAVQERKRNVAYGSPVHSKNRIIENTAALDRSEDAGSRLDEQLFVRGGEEKPQACKERPHDCEERPYDCKTCGARFAKRSTLVTHGRIHSGEKPFACDARFTQSSSLIRHRHRHSGEKPFGCDTCGAAFAQRSDLTNHRRTHSGEKPFLCETCGATFAQRLNLTKHRRTHSGEKPFACKTCGATFADRSNLTKHRRTHSGEKPFACKTCGAAFAKRSDLTKHRRTHTGEKPFACKTCGATFAQRWSLTRHRRTHLREKPFACETCKATFAERSSLTTHRRTHSGGETFRL